MPHCSLGADLPRVAGSNWRPCEAEISQHVSRSKARKLRDRRVAVRQALCKSGDLMRHIPFLSAPCQDPCDARILASSAKYSGIACKLDILEQRLSTIQILVEHLLFNHPTVQQETSGYTDKTQNSGIPSCWGENRNVDVDVCHFSGHWEAMAAPSKHDEKEMSEAALTLQRVYRGRVVRQALLEQRSMLKEDDQGHLGNKIWNFSKICPKGERRSLKLKDCRIPASDQFPLCDMCGNILPDRTSASRIHCGRGSSCCTDFHVCATCTNHFRKRKIDANSFFLE